MSVRKNIARDNFTIIPNELFTSGLSHHAFCLMALLLSKPSDWKVFNKQIMKELSIKSSHTMAKLWKECLDSGWLKRYDSENNYGSFDYEISYPEGVVHNLTVLSSDANGKVYQLSPNDIHNNTNLLTKTDYTKQNDETDVSGASDKVSSETYQDIKKWWNECVSVLGLPQVIKLSEKRVRKVKKVLSSFTQEEIESAMDNVYSSKFLSGKTSHSFKITFDWFFNQDNLLKIIEGNYNDKIQR